MDKKVYTGNRKVHYLDTRENKQINIDLAEFQVWVFSKMIKKELLIENNINGRDKSKDFKFSHSITKKMIHKSSNKGNNMVRDKFKIFLD